MTEPRYLSPRAAAADWMYRHDRDLSETERREFAAWLSAKPSHAGAWRDAEEFLDQLEDPDNPLVEAMRADALTARSPARARIWVARTVAVAAVVGGVIVGVVSTPHGDGGQPRHSTIALTAAPRFLAQTGDRTVELPDRSQAALLKGAALAVAMSPERREMRLLRGKATFSVVHEKRVFAVEARDIVVTATGTRFSVALEPDAVVATVEQGSTLVSQVHREQVVRLSAGQSIRITPSGPSAVEDVQPQASPSQPVGHGPDLPERSFVEFKRTPLSVAADKVSAASHVKIAVIGVARDIPISGRFRLGNGRDFIAAVTRILPVRARKTASGFELRATS